MLQTISSSEALASSEEEAISDGSDSDVSEEEKEENHDESPGPRLGSETRLKSEEKQLHKMRRRIVLMYKRSLSTSQHGSSEAMTPSRLPQKRQGHSVSLAELEVRGPLNFAAAVFSHYAFSFSLSHSGDTGGFFFFFYQKPFITSMPHRQSWFHGTYDKLTN